MTDRLYYDDSYSRDFEAVVVRTDARGAGWAVWLDRSSFYPTSGGQPFDTGTIGALRVVDVVDEEGDVVHVVEGGPAPHVGQRVRGVVDWTRRFDHMQQHSGQHVLSAAFVRLFNVPTVSVHLGADVSTIDLAREMTPGELAAAEDEANRVVWEDRPVTIRYASAEEGTTLGLRKESQRTGTLRLVEVDQFDLSACGGSHVSRTGAIGAIAVSASERFKGGQRLEFLCGGRLVSRFRVLRDAASASVRLLSVLPADLPGAIERLQGVARDQKRAIETQQRELAGYQAEALAATAETAAAGRAVCRAVEGDVNALKTLATAVAARPGLLVVLVSASTPVVVVAARSKDVTFACDEFVKTLVARFGGRGGGRSDLAQAGGLSGPADAIVAAARAMAGLPD